jgi:hypothetical protein
MEHLRHIAPLIAALLTVIVFAETTDVFGCPDQPVGTSQSDAGTRTLLKAADAPLSIERGGVTVHDHDSSDNPSKGTRSVPECLCQITFISTAVPPALKAPDALPVSYLITDVSVAPGEALVPSPVPLT